MKIQKHFVLLAGFLILNACGGETQTENLSDDLIHEALKQRVARSEIANPEVYQDLFEKLCQPQIPSAQAIFAQVSAGYVNGPYCWQFIMNAINENPALCSIPIRDVWTPEIYAAFFDFLLNDPRCFIDVPIP